ncbi:hypothetical protein HK100_001587, partial [Physocladia obscura]
FRRRMLDYDDDADNENNTDAFINELMLRWRLTPFLSANSNYKMIQLLIENAWLVPQANNASVLQCACVYGLTETYDYLIEKFPDLDPSLTKNFCIRFACMENHVEIVLRLLKDSRVNPAARNNQTLIFAAGAGSVEIVDLLLNDTRVDPIIRPGAYGGIGRSALSRACKGGHGAVVERLLRDPRIDPAADQSIRFAAEQGHFAIVKRLLADTRVNPSDSPSNLFRHAEVGTFDSLVQ